MSEHQFLGVEALFNNCISIITGGPGTGETTVLKVILDTYKTLYPNHKILQLAPTGRAARRMEESNRFPAYTIHKALGLISNYETNYMPIINADLIIIDEASMIDNKLAYQVLKRIQNGTRILFIGDINQLPSIGSGIFLKELINCGLIQTTNDAEPKLYFWLYLRYYKVFNRHHCFMFAFGTK